jgi:hypothetical protein
VNVRRSAVLRAAVDAADEVLSYLARPVFKALDPTDPNDILVISKQLADALKATTKGTAGSALRKAIDALDIDWPNASASQKDAVFKAAKDAVAGIPRGVLPQIKNAFVIHGTRVINGTKQAVSEEYKLNIGTTFTKQDARIVDYSATAQTNYIRDEYGKRASNFDHIARSVVAAGLDKGYDKYEIGKRLESKLADFGIARERSYWQMIAQVHTMRARTYGALSGYADAGVEQYQFQAVLDEVTTPQCRFMHNRTFSVSKGLSRYVEANGAPNPEDVRVTMPWVNAGKDDKGNEILYYKDGGGNRVKIASVTQNASGKVDEVGSFSSRHTDASLDKLGVTMPPIHANCRSTVIPIVDSISTARAPSSSYEGGGTPFRPEPGNIDEPPRYAAPIPPEAPPIPRSQDAAPAAFYPGPVDEGPRPIPVAPTPPPIPRSQDDAGGFVFTPGPIDAGPRPIPVAPTPPPIPRSQEPAAAVFVPGPVDTTRPVAAPPKPKGLTPSQSKAFDLLVASGNKGLTAGTKPGQVHPMAANALIQQGVAQYEVQADGSKILVLKPDQPEVAPKVPKHPPKPKKPKKPLPEVPAIPRSQDAAPAVFYPDTQQEPRVVGAIVTPDPTKAPPAPPPPPAVLTSADILGQKVGQQGGSNAGGVYVGKDGVERYVKFYTDPAQAAGEHLANKMYADLGHGALTSWTFDFAGDPLNKLPAGTAYASEMLVGAKPIGSLSALSKEDAKQFMKGFVADVLVGNWDAVGMTYDNIVRTADGKIIRIDNGGSFLLRAKNGRKKDVVLNAITEWEGFFSQSLNSQYAGVAGKAGVFSPADFHKEVIKQIDDVVALRKAHGGWAAYVDKIAPPSLPAADRKAMVNMLESRTKLLEEKRKELKNVGKKPKNQFVDPATIPNRTVRPAELKWYEPTKSGAPFQKGLKLEDLPESLPPPRYYDGKRGAVPDGKGGFRKVNTPAEWSNYPGARQTAIDFTDGTYYFQRLVEDNTDEELRKQGHSQSKIDAERKKIAELRAALEVLPKEPGTVYRGIKGLPKEAIDKVLNGDGIVRLAINGGATTSSSFNPDVSYNWAGQDGTHGPDRDYKIVYVIHQRSGVAVKGISNVSSEDEILLHKDMVFKVRSVSRRAGNKRVLVLEIDEIVPDENNPAPPRKDEDEDE